MSVTQKGRSCCTNRRAATNATHSSSQSRNRLIFFIDRGTGISTVMPSAAWHHVQQRIVKSLANDYPVDAALRALGTGDAADGASDLNAYSTCMSSYITNAGTMGSIYGAVIGVLVGAVAGPGGAAVGAAAGAGFAAGMLSAGIAVGNEMCGDKEAPAGPAGPPVADNTTNPATPDSTPDTTTTTTTDDTTTDGTDGAPPPDVVVAFGFRLIAGAFGFRKYGNRFRRQSGNRALA